MGGLLSASSLQGFATSLNEEFSENEALILVRQPHGYMKGSIAIVRDSIDKSYQASQLFTFDIQIENPPGDSEDTSEPTDPFMARTTGMHPFSTATSRSDSA